MVQQLDDLRRDPRRQRVNDALRAPRGRHNARLAQDAKVLGEGGLTEPYPIVQLSDGERTLDQIAQDYESLLVGDNLQHAAALAA